MKHRLALLALLAAGAAALPATAHAEPVFAGFTCGFGSISDVTAETGTQSGTTFDYYYAGDTSSGPAARVDITCSVQLNSDIPGTATAVAVSTSTAGAAGILQPTLLSYHVVPGDEIFVCTQITAFNASGQVIYQFRGEGDRCNLVTTIDGGDGTNANAEPWDREAGAGGL